MGKFDGILICSDLDGTFCRDNNTGKNCEAVKYFIENGGHFSVATGRNISHIRELGLTDIINSPCCLLNGSVIYDYDREELVKDSRLEYTLGEFLERIKLCSGKIVEFTVFEKETVFFDLKSIPAQLLNVHPYKILCRFENSEDADEFKKSVMESDSFKNTSYISKSWDVGVEFNPLDGTKGNAVEFIKKHLGNIHTSIGIGDYENDIPLLTKADIGIATGNAIEIVKNVADYIVKPCTESAVKDLIGKIEKGIIKR